MLPPVRCVGWLSGSVRQRRVTRPKDLPFGEAPLSVRWRKTQYRCQQPQCPRKAFTESIEEVPPRAGVTGRLRRHTARAIGIRAGGLHGHRWVTDQLADRP